MEIQKNNNMTVNHNNTVGKRQRVVIVVLVAILTVCVAIYLYFFQNNSSEKFLDNRELKKITELASYETKTDNQANVSVSVTPKTLNHNNESNVFNVSFNTHSVNMDYDFINVIILNDDNGNVYKAFEWNGGRGGHHLNGDIVFPKINNNAKYVQMSIEDVGGVERHFEWELID